MIYKILSPAKINIGLRVLSKRKDGYHNIETIFYPIKLYDEIDIKIEKISKNRHIISVHTNSKEKLNNKNNICFKAVKLFLAEFKIKDKYKIDVKIKKNIPIGAGLGGGSSNAASVLKILSKHFKVRNNSKLIKVALSLGSDVPFFMLSKAAYAASRGERLTLLPKFKINYKILVVNPGVHISTKWAYKELKVKGVKSKILNKLKVFNLNNVNLMVNDFERVVFKKHPKIEKLKYDMYKYGGVYALMSGSGSTVYGLYTPKKIKAAKKNFSGLGYKTFSV